MDAAAGTAVCIIPNRTCHGCGHWGGGGCGAAAMDEAAGLFAALEATGLAPLALCEQLLNLLAVGD